MNSTLRFLVGDVDVFWRRHWKRGLLRHHAGHLDLITGQDMLELIDGGLLSWPYFAVLRDGEPMPREEITTARRILNLTVPGFPHRQAVAGALGQGATLVLRQPEDWHTGIRSLVEQLRPAFDARLRSHAMLISADGPGEHLDPDGPDLLVLQLSGRARWTIAEAAGQSHHVIDPGDVLYVPHGSARGVTPIGGDSAHLAVTIEEPTPQEIVDVLVGGLLKRLESDDQALRHHLIPAQRKAAWLREHVLAYHSEIDIDAVVTAVDGGYRARL